MSTDRPQCNSCGQFITIGAGVAWKMLFSGTPPTPDREIYRCKQCVASKGPFKPHHSIKPEFSCGIFNKPQAATDGHKS